ncbi:MAG TPA: metallophosphoesterase [Thermoanaerobaculia bacterium]
MCRYRALIALLLLLPAQLAAQPYPVVAAAGDIACDPADPNFNGGNGTAAGCHMKATADVIAGIDPDAVLLLGDIQYENGALAKFQASYDPTWGSFKGITYPAPGNHDYGTPGAAGYYSYFDDRAGDPAKGYYSFDLGGWHLIALNSNCAAVGGCGAGSLQEQWLAADLAAHPGVCTLAYWHHPLFSSGPHGNDATSQAFWTDLYAAGADLVLNGHDHVYERFAPQDPSGAADPVRGIRQITVGTGGKNLTGFFEIRANSEARNATTFGVLELTLYPNGYAWRFAPEPGGAFKDSGFGWCHSAQVPKAADFHTLPPCRVLDTRQAEGPALAANTLRTFALAGACGIPADATAVAANVTVMTPSRSGYLKIYPAGAATPGTSTINFRGGGTRANNALLTLGAGGQITVLTSMPSGSTGLVVDVSGYFKVP